MISTVKLNDREVNYTLERKNVKNINLRIKADCSVYVSANDSVNEQTITDFLESRSDFILNALDRYEKAKQYTPKPKQYIDGETFRLFGHDRRLKVLQGKSNSVESDECYIYLTVKDTTDFNLKNRVMKRWLDERCRVTVSSVCNDVYQRFQKYGIEYPKIRFRSMISRWGSCQPKRKVLTFNYSLVEASIFCIEYVVTHEFTHFIQPNHSRKFYLTLQMFMPDWAERKKILEQIMTAY